MNFCTSFGVIMQSFLPLFPRLIISSCIYTAWAEQERTKTPMGRKWVYVFMMDNVEHHYTLTLFTLETVVQSHWCFFSVMNAFKSFSGETGYSTISCLVLSLIQEKGSSQDTLSSFQTSTGIVDDDVTKNLFLLVGPWGLLPLLLQLSFNCFFMSQFHFPLTPISGLSWRCIESKDFHREDLVFMFFYYNKTVNQSMVCKNYTPF